ncbi:Conserved hypothetical protein 2001 [hydrothermal vent metagenome]|uniref:Porin n=1 Tax=hydrothermal vent metagenome TaxID=652676 RepID=A0A3B0Z221_9ZZZZ
MKFAKTIIAATLLASAGVAQAEVTANVSAVSNYYFRGITQTSNGAAVQGGFDYSNESGFYAGVWGSNVDFGVASTESTEIDLYAGFGGEIGSGVSYDLGAIYYAYPGAGGKDQGGDLDYAELYVGAGMGMFSASFNYNVWGETGSKPTDNQFNDDGDYFWTISADIPMPEDFSFGAFIAGANFDSDVDDYNYWGASLTKDVGEFGSLSMNYEQNDGDDSDNFATDDSANFWLGWSKDF